MSVDVFDPSMSDGSLVSDEFKLWFRLANEFERAENPNELDFSSEDIIQEALIRISTAVSKYMPFLSLESFEPKVVKSNDGSSILNKIKVFYSVPAVAATDQVVEISIVVKS